MYHCYQSNDTYKYLPFADCFGNNEEQCNVTPPHLDKSNLQVLLVSLFEPSQDLGEVTPSILVLGVDVELVAMYVRECMSEKNVE